MTTSAFGLVRLLSGTIGISIGATAFATTFSQRAADISGYTEPAEGILGDGLYSISQLEPESLRAQVLHAFAVGLRSDWILFASLSAATLLCFLGIKKYEMKRMIKTTDSKTPAVDSEKAVDAVAPVTAAPSASTAIVDSPSLEKDSELSH